MKLLNLKVSKKVFRKIVFSVVMLSLGTLTVVSLGGCNKPTDTPNPTPVPAAAKTSQPTSSNSDETSTQLALPAKGDTIAIMKTSMGTIKIKFFPQFAPKAVEDFTTHSTAGYYNNTIFHRVIKDFMIQGGDPLGNGTGGESIWGGKFNDEISNNLHHYRGAISMANSGPNTNGSQFYIVQAPASTINTSSFANNGKATFSDAVKQKYTEVGGTPFLDGGYTLFGQVYEGMDVVDAIAATPVSGSTPVTPVKVESITISKY